MIELEVKSKEKIDNRKNRNCACSSPAQWAYVIGEVQNNYGGEYDVCGDKECIDKAFEIEREEVEYAESNRLEIMSSNRWDNRQGK